VVRELKALGPLSFSCFPAH